MPDNSGMFVILRRKDKTRLEIVYMAGCEWSRGEQFFVVFFLLRNQQMEEPPGLAAGRVQAGWSHGIYGICDPLLSVWSRAKANRVLPRERTGHTKTCYGKGRGTRDQIANIHWIIKKARGFQGNIYFCFIEYAKAVDCVEIRMQVRKQQLELDMEQHTGSK